MEKEGRRGRGVRSEHDVTWPVKKKKRKKKRLLLRNAFETWKGSQGKTIKK